MPSDLVMTRRSLHGVAELILAGQAYRAAGTIRLTITPTGFTTPPLPGRLHRLAVEGTDLVADHADGPPARLPLQGTFGTLADAVGVACEGPQGVYADTSGLGGGDAIEIDPDAARVISSAFVTGDRALRTFVAANVHEDPPAPVLWPEHFDLGISSDEVNYGISPGDSAIDEPYAYIGPWSAREGEFWNVSFGAARTVAELGGDEAALLRFFEEGRAAAAVSAT